jgi:hypothetical protein
MSDNCNHIFGHAGTPGVSNNLMLDSTDSIILANQMYIKEEIKIFKYCPLCGIKF